MTPILLATCLALGQAGSIGQPESLTLNGTGVVLTDGGQLYEGRIDRLGEFVRVMSGGRTTVLKSVNVVFTGETKDDAYGYLKSKKKADNASDAAGLADWCRKYGLMKEAVAEVKTALRLAPDDRGIAKLAIEIEDDAKRPRPVLRVVGSPTPPVKPVTAKPIPAAPLPTMPGEMKTAMPPALEQSFVKAVQPLLMNACANCHADANRAVNFRLARVPEGITVSPHSAENALATWRMVNAAQPTASPLITYALAPHGGRSTAPLQKGTQAIQNLELWATAAAKMMPAQAPVAPVPPVAAQAPPAAAPTPTPTPTASLPSLIIPPPAPVAVETPATAPVDPFDPVQFHKSGKR